jgi:hypothetical protein
MAECEWVLLCDYAFPDQRGKLCVVGIFDNIFSGSIPVQHDRAFLAFSIVGEPGEDVRAKITIISPTAKVIASFQLNAILPEAGSAQGHIEIRALPLTEWGRHAIEVEFGDGVPKAAWFTLQQAQRKQ